MAAVAAVAAAAAVATAAAVAAVAEILPEAVSPTTGLGLGFRLNRGLALHLCQSKERLLDIFCVLIVALSK